jgi:carboxyl-terminal processing protease
MCRFPHRKPARAPWSAGRPQGEIALASRLWPFRTRRRPGLPVPRALSAVSLVLAGVLVGAALPRGFARAGSSDPLAAAEDAYNLLLTNFDGTVSPAKLLGGAIAGMMNALGDPFTTYLAPGPADQSFNASLNGLIGIGVEIQAMAGGYVIDSVVAGGPAQAAGLRSGDLIVTVDGQPVAGQTVDQVTTEIGGALGTPVTLGVLVPGGTGPQSFTMERADISPPTVVASSPAPGIGMIRITEFGSDTASEWDGALAALRARPGGLQGLIIDLRNNPGGYVSAAIHIAGEIAPAGPLLIVTQKTGPSTTYSAPAHAPFPPTVILVNGETASAAEILAGTLQWSHAAVLVGQRTYGKGSVQQLFPLPNGGAAKITVGFDELPNGVSWEYKGLTPDVAVPPPTSAVASLPAFATVGGRTLRPGMIGLDVYGLQQRLGLLGFYDGPDSGVYDPLTEAAVELFQRAAGLPVTGTMAPADWTALGVAMGVKVQQLASETPPDTTLQTGLRVLHDLMTGAPLPGAAGGGA